MTKHHETAHQSHTRTSSDERKLHQIEHPDTSRLDLSIVIVTFDRCQLVCGCLDSIMRLAGNIEYEIIIVDNGSTDGTVDVVATRFPFVRIISNERNLGFAAGNNQGIAVSRGRYIFLLNQDAEVIRGTLADLVRILDNHPRIGILGCKVVLPDGAMQPTYSPSPTLWNTLITERDKRAYERLLLRGQGVSARSQLASEYERKYGYQDFHEVATVSGIAMMVRREMCEQIGLLDERFFMYYEDQDWCLRARLAGWKVFYTPECTTCHHYTHVGSSDRSTWGRIAVMRRSRLFYFRKHRPWYEFAFLALAELVGAWLHRLDVPVLHQRQLPLSDEQTDCAPNIRTDS